MPLSDDDIKALGKFGSPKEEIKLDPAITQSPELQKFMGANPQMAEDMVGRIPRLAVPESPLSPLERAAFGYEHPERRMKYLEEKFGKGNVEPAKMDEESTNFVVKHDGVWKQVDPHGISDIPMDWWNGQDPQVMRRLKNTMGGLAQFVGEKGAVSLAAGAGAAAAAPYGAPLGPLGVLGAGVAGGIMGGAGGSLVDSGVREASAQVESLTGKEITGAHKYNVEDLGHQILGDAVFGGEQELAGAFLKAGSKEFGKGASVLLSKAFSAAETPAEKTRLAMQLKVLGGLSEGEARVAAANPTGVLQHMPDVVNDFKNNTSKIQQANKQDINTFFSQSQKAMRGLGRQYQAIEDQASGKVFNALETDKEGGNPMMEAFQNLRKEGYLNDTFEVQAPKPNEITRDTSGTNGQAIKKMADDFHALLSKDGKASYRELRIMEGNVENRLFGENQITDGKLRSIMGQMRAAINTVQSKGLHEVDPELSGQLAGLNAKYGPAKELLGTLGQKSEDQRLDAFLKQIFRDDGSYNAELMNSIGSTLGVNNPTQQILERHTATKLRPLVSSSGKRILGTDIPQSPRLAQEYLKAQQPITEQSLNPTETIAYKGLQRFGQTLKALPTPELKSGFSNSVGLLPNLLSGAAVKEQTDKSQLLKQAGDFQGSQFGQ